MITFSYLALLLFYCNYSFLYNFILIHPEVPIGCPKKRLWIFWSKYTFLYKSHWSGSIFVLFEGSQPQNVLISEAAIQMCSWEKVFWKYSANWKENTHAECKATFLKSHFCMGFLLSICCIFSEHLFFKKTSGWLDLLFLSYLGQNFLMLLGYFNTTPEVFKVIQSDRTSDYITKNEFHGVTIFL